MDDDIGGFKILKHKFPNHPVDSTQIYRKGYFLDTLNDLDDFVKSAFKNLKKNKLFLWGLYPIANPYFMFPATTIDLKLIVGPVWGSINRHDKDLILTIDEKEDVERTLQYYTKDGGVIRFNNICVQTTYYKTPGGMQADKRDRKADSLEKTVEKRVGVPRNMNLYENKNGGKMIKKAKNGTSFGMLSVKAGIDKNPKPTAADRIAGAKKKMKSGGTVSMQLGSYTRQIGKNYTGKATKAVGLTKAKYGTSIMKKGGKCKNGC